LASLQPAPQNCGAPYSFFLFSSRKIAEEQRNCGPLGLTAEGRKTLTAWLVRRSG
jgi:hypothetical protein